MAYQRKSTFDIRLYGEYEGLTLLMIRPSIGEYIDWQHILDMPAEDARQTAEQAEAILDYLGPRLVDWSMVDEDDKPVQVGRDGLAAQEWELVKEIGGAFGRAVRRVPDPLGPPSTDGLRSVEASIPMEMSSPSPES